jgi:hypothetical protein
MYSASISVQRSALGTSLYKLVCFGLLHHLALLLLDMGWFDREERSSISV